MILFLLLLGLIIAGGILFFLRKKGLPRSIQILSAVIFLLLFGGGALIFVFTRNDSSRTSLDELTDQSGPLDPPGNTEIVYACEQNTQNCYQLYGKFNFRGKLESFYSATSTPISIKNADCNNGFCTVEEPNGKKWNVQRIENSN